MAYKCPIYGYDDEQCACCDHFKGADTMSKKWIIFESTAFPSRCIRSMHAIRAIKEDWGHPDDGIKIFFGHNLHAIFYWKDIFPKALTFEKDADRIARFIEECL